VDCWYSEEDEMTYWGVVLDAVFVGTDDSTNTSTTEDDNYANHLLVRFDLNAGESWVPAAWCDPLETVDVWEPNIGSDEQTSVLPRLLYSSDDNPVNLFHRAFRIIADRASTYRWSAANDLGPAGALFSYDYGVHPGAFGPSFPRNLLQTEGIKTYQPITNDDAAAVDNKYQLYLSYANNNREKDGSAAAAFPVTYGTVREALEDADNGDEGREAEESLYFLKPAGETLGDGIRVLRLSELREEEEVEEEEYVIQKAVIDLLTVDDNDGADEGLRGRRFDIRFYLLVVRGNLYLHSHIKGHWTWTKKPYDPEDSSIENNVLNIGPNLEKESERVGRDVHYFSDSEPIWQAQTSCSKATGFNPRQWRMAILEALRLARPAFETVMEATAVDPTRYMLLGGDAIMQKSGKAVLLEFNHFAGFGLHSTYERCKSQEARDCMRRLILEDPTNPCGYVIASQEEVVEPKVAIGYLSDMIKDVAVMVLRLEEAEDMPHFHHV
jgi:hypothetical protein